MDYEKFKTLLQINIEERSIDDINKIIKLSYEIKFVKALNSSEIFYEVCRNAELKKFEKEEKIYSSEEALDENFLIIEGEVNYYELKMENNIRKSVKLIFLKSLQKGDDFGNYEISLINEKLNSYSKRNFLAIANFSCELALFKNINKKTEIKTMISKKIEKNKNDHKNHQQENVNKHENFNSNLNDTENEEKTENINFINKKERKNFEENTKQNNIDDITFDPEIFLIEEKDVLNNIIDKVKERYEKEFDFLHESYKIEKMLKDFENQEINNFLEENHQNTNLEFSEFMKSVDNRFINYTDNTKKEIKYALLFKKFLTGIHEIKKKFSDEIDKIKKFNYAKDDSNNKNLLLLSIEEEIKKPEFESYIKDRINREGKLNSSLDEKNKNTKLIQMKKEQIKKDEEYLLKKYYCVLCYAAPRTILIKNCNHLIMCDVCIKTIQVCPRCGINIDKYDKIFR